MKQVGTISLIAVGLLACSSASRHVPSPIPPRAMRTAEGAVISLSVRVVSDPAARGLEPPKALEVTLRNDPGADDVAWVNGRMAPRTAAGGEVDISLKTEQTRLVDTCLHNLPSPEEKDYVRLAPGSSITRILSLSCFHPPSAERLWLTATYQDADPPPGKVGLAFDGELTSNTVSFVMRDPKFE